MKLRRIKLEEGEEKRGSGSHPEKEIHKHARPQQERERSEREGKQVLTPPDCTPQNDPQIRGAVRPEATGSQNWKAQKWRVASGD